MTPKEKAEELVRHFKGRGMDGNENYAAKECALIVVDEILDAISGMVDEENGYSADEYYLEVKNQIEL